MKNIYNTEKDRENLDKIWDIFFNVTPISNLNDLFITKYKSKELTGSYNELKELTGNSIACVFIRLA